LDKLEVIKEELKQLKEGIEGSYLLNTVADDILSQISKVMNTLRIFHFPEKENKNNLGRFGDYRRISSYKH